MSLFSATFGDVEGEFPSTESNPFGGSNGVGPTQEQVESWMIRGGAVLESVVKARGVSDLGDLSAADQHALSGAVIAFATAKALEKMRRYEQSSEYMRQYREVLELWRNRPMDIESATVKSTTYSSPRNNERAESRFLDGRKKW
jgi:hypothetical protein